MPAPTHAQAPAGFPLEKSHDDRNAPPNDRVKEETPGALNVPENDVEKAMQQKVSPGHWWRVNEVQEVPKK